MYIAQYSLLINLPNEAQYLKPFLFLQVVKDDPPRLEAGKFSPEFENFVTACLQKKYTDRPNYEQLLQHVFLVEHMTKDTDVAGFVEEILNLPDA